MDDCYLKQAALVVRCIPAIAKEGCFAIKGGTAINLFELDLPRLSVDIDLTFTRITDRPTAIREINAALVRIARRLQHERIDVAIRGSDGSGKLYCSYANSTIKIEPNFILRGTIHPPRSLSICETISNLTQLDASMAVLSRAELYGGKFCAALDRQHPRDLFDVAQFYKTSTITSKIKSGFLALALGHNRPLHELLNPTLQDHEEIFKQQFAGMSDTPFSYQEHKDTFVRLREGLLGSLTDDDKQHLIDFVSLQGHPEDFGIHHLAELPAIIWKRKNLETLRMSNHAKFTEQRKLLARLLE